jgi:hypothetical protein
MENHENDASEVQSGSEVIGRFYPKSQTSIRRGMWVGVICIGIIIGVLWGWGIKMQIERTSQHASSDDQLASETKQNWNEAFATEQADAAKSNTSVRDQLRAVVNTITAASAAASTTATSSVISASSTVSTTR